LYFRNTSSNLLLFSSHISDFSSPTPLYARLITIALN
jgi:hypothetical protein